jgi:hypothetical protein
MALYAAMPPVTPIATFLELRGWLFTGDEIEM